MKVSYFKTITNPDDIANPSIVDLDSICKAIKNGKWKEQISAIRLCASKKDADPLKKKLPAVLFAGEFENRSIIGFKSSSNLVCIDFDNIPTNEMESYRNKFESDPFIYRLFIGPRGNGFKAIIRASFDSYEAYKRVFCAIDSHFNQSEYFDVGCSDISRACFVSYDPQMFENNDSEIFTDEIQDWEGYLKRRRLMAPEETMKYLIKWMDNSSFRYVDGNKNNYVYRLAAAMCRYGVLENTTEGLFISKFNEWDIHNLQTVIYSAYKRNEFGIVKITITDPSQEKDFYNKLETPDFEFDPASVLIDPAETNASVMQISRGAIQSQSFGLKALDKYLLLKRREMYGFVAGSKAGKTLLISQLSLMAAKYSSWKFLVLTTETEVDDYKATMVSFMRDKDIKKCTPEEIIESLEFIDKHFQFIKNEVDHLQIFDVYHYTKTKNTDFDAIIIDPITNISRSKKIKGTGNDYYDELYTQYLRFAKAHCSLWIVAHTVTSKEREHIMPFVQDAEYGVYLARRCHYGITFHRDAQDDMRFNVVECHIRYVRSALTKGGTPTLKNSPLEFTFHKSGEHSKIEQFHYDITVEGLTYENPLLYDNKQKLLDYGTFNDTMSRIEKEPTYTLGEERDAKF